MKAPARTHSARSCLTIIGALTGLLALCFALVGCANGSAPSASSTLTTAAGGGSTSFRVVSFTTEDGLKLSGRLYGTGGSAVLLCHMYPADQTSWEARAQTLAQNGFLAMTFDFRGYGQSQGQKDIQYLDRDVTAAVQFLRELGAQEVVLVGASMGGTACLKAAAELQTLSSIRLAGVVTFSAPVEFKGLSAQDAVPAIQVPMMFVAAQGDVGAQGARTLEQLSGHHGDLEILPGSDHGTNLFKGSQAAAAAQLLLDFVQQNLSGGS